CPPGCRAEGPGAALLPALSFGVLTAGRACPAPGLDARPSLLDTALKLGHASGLVDLPRGTPLISLIQALEIVAICSFAAVREQHGSHVHRIDPRDRGYTPTSRRDALAGVADAPERRS